MATNVNELIFIKRVKKKAHEHAHGGAWKIAYADFVTAMMAFFLLMWLLNATTEDQRTAISNYFAPASVSKSTSGAGGVLGGRSLDSEGAMVSNASRPGLILGVRVPSFGTIDGNTDDEPEDADGDFLMRGPVDAHEYENADGSHMGTLEAHEFEQGGGSHLGTVEKNDAKNAKGKFLARAEKDKGPKDKYGVSNLDGDKEGAGDKDGKGQSTANGADNRDMRMSGAVRKDSRYAHSRYAEGRYNQRSKARQEQRRFAQTEAVLKKLFSQDSKLAPYKDNLRVEQIGAGLRIQMLDNHKNEMFPLGSAEMEQKTNEIMAKIAESIKKLPNKIAIVGHTDATPYRADSGYSNWELSTDRAHASRRALIAAGLPADRIANVTGKADTELLNKADPESPVNRRISILLLREDPPANEPGRNAPSRRSFNSGDNPYSSYRSSAAPRRTVPAVTPTVPQAAQPAFDDDDVDPLEESETKAEETEETPVEATNESADSAESAEAEAEPAEETAEAEEESAEAEAADAEIETAPDEEYEPVPVERELIDSDLFQRL